MPIYNTTVKATGGLIDTRVDPSLITNQQASDMSNVMKYGDYVGQRPGRISHGTLSGIVKLFYHFKVSATNRFMAFTNDKIYYRTSTKWTEVTGTNMTGTIDDHIDVCTVYDDNTGTFYVVFTNGVDNIRNFDGTNNTSDLSAWTDYKARFVRQYRGYLVAAHVTDTGTRHGYRFMCSHTDNPNDTTSANAKTFNLTIDRNISDIMRVEHFGNFLTVYKTDCIYGMWLGSTKNIFEFDVWIHNVGLKASQALCLGQEGEHFFLGNDDFYYWPNRNSRPVGLTSRKVRTRIFDNTDPNNITRSLCAYDSRHNQVRLYVPETDLVETVYVLDLSTETWTWWKESVSNVTAVASYDKDIVVTIDELIGTIDAQTGSIDNLSGQATDNFPVIIEGLSTGAVQYDDESTYNDGSTAIDSFYNTGDTIYTNDEQVPFSYERVLGIKVEAAGWQSSGDRLYMYYSTDEGSSWTAINTGVTSDGTEWSDYITLTDSWAWYRGFFDVKCTKIRFKFLNDAASSTWNVRKWRITDEETEAE